MSAAKVLRQLTSLIETGKVSEETARKLLEESGAVFTCKGQKGTYCNGMLKVAAGKITLDPLAITGFSFPEPPAPPAPKPAPKPKPEVKTSGASSSRFSGSRPNPASTPKPDVTDPDS